MSLHVLLSLVYTDEYDTSRLMYLAHSWLPSHGLLLVYTLPASQR